MSASPKSVCIPCRRVYKGEGRKGAREDGHVQKGWPYFPRRWAGTGAGQQVPPGKCPECGLPTVLVSHTWRPPRRTNDRAWKRIARGDWFTEVGRVG